MIKVGGKLEENEVQLAFSGNEITRRNYEMLSQLFLLLFDISKASKEFDSKMLSCYFGPCLIFPPKKKKRKKKKSENDWGEDEKALRREKRYRQKQKEMDISLEMIEHQTDFPCEDQETIRLLVQYLIENSLKIFKCINHESTTPN